MRLIYIAFSLSMIVIRAQTPAQLYESGDYAMKRYDVPNAVYYFKKAASQGNAKAQFSLGGCYYQGLGVPMDYTEAAKLTRKAAEQGLPEAEGLLGLFYVLGRGVPKDLVEAWAWLDLSVTAGETTGAQTLAETTKRLSKPELERAQARERKLQAMINARKAKK